MKASQVSRVSGAGQTAHTWVVKMGKVYGILDIGGLSTFDGGGKITGQVW